jgi:hypothetical protein
MKMLGEIMKINSYFICLLLLIINLLIFVACQNDIHSQEEKNIEGDADMNNSELLIGTFPPTTSTWAKVVEITSEFSFIVEIITPRWTWWLPSYEKSERGNGDFIIGDIVEVKYNEDERWVRPVIRDLLDVGTIIQFHRDFLLYPELTDYTQEPFVTWAKGLVVYYEGEEGVMYIEGSDEITGLIVLYDNPYFGNRHVNN